MQKTFLNDNCNDFFDLLNKNSPLQLYKRQKPVEKCFSTGFLTISILAEIKEMQGSYR